MYKKFFTTLSIVAMTLFLVPACAEQDNGTEASASTTTTDAVKTADGEQASVMDLPVDFSTPENVDKSIEKVKQEAGETKARNLSIAMKYLLTYDLSVSHNEEKLHKKLNGSTPNEIIAKMER